MTIIFDLRCGVSGDMLLGALLDAFEGDKYEVIHTIEKAASVMSPTTVNTNEIERFDLKAISIDVIWESMEVHSTGSMDMIAYMGKALDTISANPRVQKMAKRILQNILEAEMIAHKCRLMEDVHLHEAGTPDTLVDAIGISLLFDKLEMDGEWIHATPISLGAGKVRTDHGLLDVPVPAVRAMIRNIPVRTGPVEGELATPTGVAAVSSFVEIWMDHENIGDSDTIDGRILGRGAGSREYSSFPNILTIMEVDE